MQGRRKGRAEVAEEDEVEPRSAREARTARAERRGVGRRPFAARGSRVGDSPGGTGRLLEVAAGGRRVAGSRAGSRWGVSSAREGRRREALPAAAGRMRRAPGSRTVLEVLRAPGKASVLLIGARARARKGGRERGGQRTPRGVTRARSALGRGRSVVVDGLASWRVAVRGRGRAIRSEPVVEGRRRGGGRQPGVGVVVAVLRVVRWVLRWVRRVGLRGWRLRRVLVGEVVGRGLEAGCASRTRGGRGLAGLRCGDFGCALLAMRTAPLAARHEGRRGGREEAEPSRGRLGPTLAHRPQPCCC